MLYFDHALIGAEWHRDVRIGIVAGRIATVEQGIAQPDDDLHAIGIPGLCNLHSHAFQRGMAGLTERGGASANSFWSWRTMMYRFVDRIGPAELKALAAQAYVEMLESGFTRVGEFHYVHHDPQGMPYDNPAEMAAAIASAASDCGIGLTLLPVFYAHAQFGGGAPMPAQRRFVNDPDRFALLVDASRVAVSSLPDAVVGIAPHSLRAVAPAELAAINTLGDGPIHIHIAEQRREVVDCIAWSGARPVEWLLDNAPVDARWCCVHATHMIDAETRRLAATGAVAGLCPITEANLGDGVFPAVPFLDSGGRFGIGTDSNVMIDAAEELRLLEYGQRLIGMARNVMARGTRSTGGSLFDATCTGGAQALGVDSGIKVGGSADIVSLNPASSALVGRSGDTLLDSWIFAARSLCTDTVWRCGQKIVVNGKHRFAAAIRAQFDRTLERIMTT